MELQEIETKIDELRAAKNELLKDQLKRDALNAVSSDKNGNLVLNVWSYDNYFQVEEILNNFAEKGWQLINLSSYKEKEYYSQFKITVERL